MVWYGTVWYGMVRYGMVWCGERLSVSINIGRSLIRAYDRAGFTGGLVVDYPNSTKAKKYYLCLSFEHGYKTPEPKVAEQAGGAAKFDVSYSAGGLRRAHLLCLVSVLELVAIRNMIKIRYPLYYCGMRPPWYSTVSCDMVQAY